MGGGTLPKKLPLSTQGGYPGVPILAGLDGGGIGRPADLTET